MVLAGARPEAGYSYSPPSTSYGAPSGGGGGFSGGHGGGGIGGGGIGGGGIGGGGFGGGEYNNNLYYLFHSIPNHKNIINIFKMDSIHI